MSEIELRESERDVEIRSGASGFHLRTLPAEDFPAFPATEGDPLPLPATGARLDHGPGRQGRLAG